MKWTLLIISIILLSSCLTVKKIERNCDKFAAVCLTKSSDTVFVTKEVEVIYRDTTVEYLIYRDTVYKETPVYIEKGLVNAPISHLEVGLAKSDAWVKNSVQKHFLQSGDTVLQIRLDNALRDVSVLNTRLEKHQDIVTIKENTKFAEFTVKWFWISFFVIVILVAVVVFKNRLLGIFKKL